jgi:hypothetical protein
MKWLASFIASSIFLAASQALALPQPQAEEAFARGDYEAAYRLMLPLAEQGSLLARKRIAEMYAKGLGVPQDLAMANQWYQRALEQATDDERPQGEAALGPSSPPAADDHGDGMPLSAPTVLRPVPATQVAGMPNRPPDYLQPTSAAPPPRILPLRVAPRGHHPHWFRH